MTFSAFVSFQPALERLSLWVRCATELNQSHDNGNTHARPPAVAVSGLWSTTGHDDRSRLARPLIGHTYHFVAPSQRRPTSVAVDESGGPHQNARR